MNINIHFYNHYATPYRNRHDKPQASFKGQGTVFIKKTKYKKIAPFILAGVLAINTLSKCSTTRLTGKEDYPDFNVEYYNVKKDTKDELINAYKEFKSKLTPENDFLNGVNLILTDDCANLDDDNSFKTFLKNSNKFGHAGGMSFYSDNKLSRNIVIQEKVHNFNDEFYNIITTGEKTIVPQLRHSLMHEVGHQFDEYFGHDHNEKFAFDFDSIMYVKEQNPYENPYQYSCKSEKENSIMKIYNDNNTLSDKNDFKNAILKDFQNVVRIKNEPYEFLPPNIKYFTQGVDLTKEITPEAVKDADRARMEVYASLFSYALGENDGDKADFINAFPNSFEVVKNDIKEFLGESFIK